MKTKPYSIEAIYRDACNAITQLDGLHGDPSKNANWTRERRLARALVGLIDRMRADVDLSTDYWRDNIHRDAQQRRRDRNRAAGKCINENQRGSHGDATHGVCCAKCRDVHSGPKFKRAA